MPEDYRKIVFAAYLKKKNEGGLSSNLLDPTPGNVREECLIVYRERERNSKDDEIFRQFFKGVDKEKGYLAVLEGSLAEKFKQMPNILKGRVPKHGIRYAELLAWLIDFQPRPSTSYYTSFYKDKPTDVEDVIDTTDVKIDEINTDTTEGNDTGKQNQIEEENNRVEELEKQEGSNKEVKGIIDAPTGSDFKRSNDVESKVEERVEVLEPVIEPVYKTRFASHQIIIACIILLFISGTSFMVWERMPTTVRTPNGDENSMYWDGDHYEPVKEGEQKPGVTIIPLDLKTLKGQRKINLPDTMTKYSLGKVWYKGRGKDHEFFTDSGIYPPDTSRRLLPLSSTILRYSSYDRYLLTRLVWFLSAAFFISLCGYWAGTLKKEVKSKETDDTEKLLALESQQVINEHELKPVLK
jgi:hypothetical protein